LALARYLGEFGEGGSLAAFLTFKVVDGRFAGLDVEFVDLLLLLR
jgi:hypothetical protein